ncbi:MAG: putative Puromycin-sensitive aminopeptidase [Streblomastix strix]|uniref:Aminopeptidase n=1 Tax=Streblomastix strix TaxID=222440 RepID=A0A5J4V0S8_9EUKA|nr:MAG: putative Puromycin-sensitive aminopeptidase [Streblomastix strix]
MSTYLVAWVVGEFEFVSGSCYDGKLPVRVYTLPGQCHSANFALECAIEAIEYLSQFTSLPIPLPKMDLIAIPDFQAGAMENWGLITFREVTILANPTKSTSAALQRVGYVICHELVHQWAGNLVTPSWWEDLWLNEGFATFLGEYVLDKLHPEYNRWLTFLTQHLNHSFSIDGMEESTHPIEVKVIKADDVDDVFDTISYSKSASVIRMMFEFIGEESFRKGFSSYLKKHAYANAVSEDLWEALAESSGRSDLTAMMKSWTQQAGFPLVSVKEIKSEKKEDINNENERVFELTQQRFSKKNLKKLIDIKQKGKSIDQKDEQQQLWQIPISVYALWKGYEKPIKVSFDLKDRKTIFKIKAPIKDCADGIKESTLLWIKLNAEQIGYYRVLYEDEQIMNELSNELKHEGKQYSILPQSDRMGLQNDLFALSEITAGELISFPFCLEFARAGYQNEDSYAIWSDLLSNIRSRMRIFIEGAVNLAEENEQLNKFGKEGNQELYKLNNENVRKILQNYDQWTIDFIIKKVQELNKKDDQISEKLNVQGGQNLEFINNQQLKNLLVGLIIRSGHKSVTQQYVNEFDTKILPALSQFHKELIKKSSQKEKEQSVDENDKIQFELRKEVDERLAIAVNSIQSERRGLCFCGAVESSNQSQSVPGQYEISSLRRIALFAIYKCTSPLLLPNDRNTALMYLCRFTSQEQIQSMMNLIIENEEKGIKRQDCHHVAFQLSGIAGCAKKQWQWFTQKKEIEGEIQRPIWNTLKSRMAAMLLSYFVQYASSSIVPLDYNDSISQEVDEFFKENSKLLPPYAVRKSLESIKDNQVQWQKSADVLDWILKF